MGTALADAADRALLSAAVLELPRLRATCKLLEIEQRRPTAEQVRLARWYLEEAEGDIEEAAFTRELYGHSYTFHSQSPEIQRWFARETIGMWEWQRRSDTRRPADLVEIQALGLGDVAFVGFPCELFSELGLRVKEASPFSTTVICELANGYVGYVPTRQAFDHGGYEPRFAYSSRLVPEAGDLMTDAALELLHQLAGSVPGRS
jgi:hypothetical protein